MHIKTLYIQFTALLLAVLLLLISGCGSKQAAPAKPMVPVTVAKVEQKTMPQQVEANGVVEAYNTVTIIPQVTGRILRINFRQGSFVEAGELLAVIDPSSYQADLQAAEATIAQQESQNEYKKVQAQRYAELWQQQAISLDQYDYYMSQSNTQSAVYRNAVAAAEALRIKVDRCYISSPISGVTGAYITDIGNLVTENTTKLVTINQIQPVFVNFTVPEKNLAAIKSEFASKGALTVNVRLPDNGGGSESGKLVFIDNTVDIATGTIKMKAEYVNQSRSLWPGRYADVTVILGEQQGAIVVPAEAVNQSQEGYFVFVVNPEDNTASKRVVILDRQIGQDYVIKSGLAAGETVVTDGELNLTDGATVDIKTGDK